jgi:hypothetical protein
MIESLGHGNKCPEQNGNYSDFQVCCLGKSRRAENEKGAMMAMSKSRTVGPGSSLVSALSPRQDCSTLGHDLANNGLVSVDPVVMFLRLTDLCLEVFTQTRTREHPLRRLEKR